MSKLLSDAIEGDWCLGLRICQWGQIGGQQADDVVVVEGVIMSFSQYFLVLLSRAFAFTWMVLYSFQWPHAVGRDILRKPGAR